ncbi:hypothetical protein A2872_00880 [Candidatus Gottesmanbacteria bacterium RIFCSPHIGHO2_01_FULL_42_12]|uniref:RNase H type-1 domain-containing protein n=1 Tax=Candidatus Gottesmanbacteria bacterium RIFCSPHIGHO2_01_FULL_42_12 TaxID=1798377 RepID=A0A1F5Z2V8_9BACT|nr:MAG: hypothetical protein A2872_00880 [Candidatus Gottesmanbacteria bacterium RIFCSPHIGHO2_01_FULL_42_12]
MNLKIFTDGGSRGNPGFAACAYVVYSSENLREKSGKYLGVTTNNVAEYQGVITALKDLKSKLSLTNSDRLDFYLDSLLVVSQLKGAWKVKDAGLKPLVLEINNLTRDLNVSWNFVPREQNKEADLLVNNILDNHGTA